MSQVIPDPSDIDRRDMQDPNYDPTWALVECLDLWESGAWPDENAVPNLDEVMQHLRRLFSFEVSVDFTDGVVNVTTVIAPSKEAITLDSLRLRFTKEIVDFEIEGGS